MLPTHYGNHGWTPQGVNKEIHTEAIRRFYETHGYKTMCGIRVKGEQIVPLTQVADCWACRLFAEESNSFMYNLAKSMIDTLGE